ncbi:hypothetical protein PG994_012599 [Apiospora phragmitis]|uniref:Uncharacterized protein n=1 Tax=Apiospora phragmitis TaxID=2905665 RepID=A0ABR1TCN9_9PEZI
MAIFARPVADPPEGGYPRHDYWSCHVNRDIRRLRWSIDGPLDKAVLVMHSPHYNPDDLNLSPPTVPGRTEMAPKPGMSCHSCLCWTPRYRL